MPVFPRLMPHGDVSARFRNVCRPDRILVAATGLQRPLHDVFGHGAFEVVAAAIIAPL
jgi:hypothetical protein